MLGKIGKLYEKRYICISIIKEVNNILWKDHYVRKSVDKDTVLELYRLMKSLLGVNSIRE